MGRHGSQRAGEGLDLLARVRRLPPPRPGGVDEPGLFTPRARGPDRPLLEPAAAVRAGVVKDVFHAGGTEGDRKSTRLNSSHRCISYAVFCLKKKTKIEKA